MGQMLCPVQSVSVSLKVKELEQREGDIISHARPSPTVTGQEVNRSKRLLPLARVPVCSPVLFSLRLGPRGREGQKLGRKLEQRLWLPRGVPKGPPQLSRVFLSFVATLTTIFHLKKRKRK